MRKLLLLIATLLPGLGFGQSVGVDWHKVAGGGGDSTNGALAISGTIGQYDAQTATNGNLQIIGGFWAGDCPTILLSPGALPTGFPGANYNQVIVASGGFGTYTFTYAGTLPDGLNLSGGGVLSGLTTNSGSFSFTVTATDANGCTGSSNYVLSVGCPIITVSPVTLTNAPAAAAYSQAFTADGGAGPYTYSENGMLPGGLTFSANGVLSGTPTNIGAFPITVIAVDTNTCLASRNYVLNVFCPSIQLSPGASPDAVAAVSYSQTFTASAGVPPYSFGKSGTLPGGLMLTSGGLLSGTPTNTGVFNFTLIVTDANSCQSSSNYVLNVNCPSIAMNPPALPNATAAVGYNQAIMASAGVPPYSFIATGGLLPPGLTLSSAGALTGTPTNTGLFNFTVIVSDANSCQASNNYSINVGCPVIKLSPGVLAAPTAAVSYNQIIAASAGVPPYSFAATSGTLPPGLTLSGAGVLSGTPTNTGPFNFTITATDVNSCQTSSNYVLNVGCPVIALSSGTLNATAAVSYGHTNTASGGVPPYTFTKTGALPSGLALSSGGVISGTPTVTGTFQFTVTATDVNNCQAASNYVMDVACPGLVLSPATLTNGTVRSPYSRTFGATAGVAPYSFAKQGTLPSGMIFTSSGVLSGTPTVVGTFNFTITATDANGCQTSSNYALNVDCATMTVNPATLADGTTTVPFTQTFTTTGGLAPYSYSKTGSLPGGITLSSAGVLSGTPTSHGTFNFTVQATDSQGCVASRSLSWFIHRAPVANSTHVTLLENGSTNFTLSCTDPDGTLTNFIITASPAHGKRTGSGPNQTYTPHHDFSGTDTISFQVMDNSATSAVASVSFTIIDIYPPPTATPQSVTLNENIAKAITLHGTDPLGSNLTYTVMGNPAHGVLSGTAPALTYTPTLNFYGSDSFSFSVSDVHHPSSNAVVSLTVNHVNQKPVVGSLSVTSKENDHVIFTLPVGDVDGPQTNVFITGPSHGQLTLIPPNNPFTPVAVLPFTYRYTPNSGYYGKDSFSYYANDGSLNSSTQTVAIVVLNEEQQTLAFSDLLSRGFTNAPDGGYKVAGKVPMTFGDIHLKNGVWTATSGTVTIDGVAFDVTSATIPNSTQLKFDGALHLPSPIPKLIGDDVSVDVSGVTLTAATGGIAVSDISACYNSTLALSSVFNITKLCISYDGPNTYAGSSTAKIDLGKGWITVEGDISVSGGVLKTIGADASDLHYPIGDTGAYLNELGGSLNNLQSTTSWYINGNAEVYAGPKVLGVYAADLFVNGSLSAQGDIAASGDGYFFGFYVGTASLKCYPTKLYVEASASASFFYGVLVGSADITAMYIKPGTKIKIGSRTITPDPGPFVYGSVSATLNVPENSWLLPGTTVGGVDASVSVSTSDIFISGDVTVLGVSYGFHLDNRTFGIGRNAVPLVVTSAGAWERPYNAPILTQNGQSITFMDNWSSLGRVSTGPTGRAFSVPAGGPAPRIPGGAPDTVATFDVPADQAAVIFRLTYSNTNATSVTMTLDTPVVSDLDVNNGSLPVGFTNLPNSFAGVSLAASSAYFAIARPTAGTYTINLWNTNDLGNYTVELLSQNPPPTATINSITPTETPGVFDINYTTLCNTDAAPMLNIFLGHGNANFTRRVGPSYTLCFTNAVNETNDILIDVSSNGVPPGTYQVIVEVNDPSAGVAVAISTGQLTVGDPAAPLPVPRVATSAGDQSFTVVWDPSPSTNVVSYIVYYTTGSQPFNYNHYEVVDAASTNPTSLALTGLTNGQPYLVTVAARDDQGLQSLDSQVLRVVPSAGPGLAPPIIISQPPVNATAEADQYYVYAVQTFDGDQGTLQVPLAGMPPTPPVPVDANGIYWELPIAPPGMTITTNGVIMWTPSDSQVGTNQVTVRATKVISDFGLAPTSPPLVAEQSFALNVLPNIIPPAPGGTFLSRPPTSIHEGQTYSYTPQVMTANPAFAITVMQGPPGMSVSEDTNGVDTVVWPAPVGAAGQQVILRAAPRNDVVTPADYVYQEYYLSVVSTNNQLPPINLPVPTNTTLDIGLDESTTIPVSQLLANAAAAPGVTLSLVSVTNGLYGITVLSGTNVIYTPSAGYSGADHFTYILTDGVNLITGTVYVAVNHRPVLSVSPYEYTFSYYFTNTMPGPHFGEVTAISNVFTMQLSWPVYYSNYVLQACGDLADPAGWGYVNNVTNNTSTIIVDTNAFFRLIGN